MSLVSQAQVTIASDVRIRSAAGTAPNVVIPVNGGILYADGNGLVKKTSALMGIGWVPVDTTSLRTYTTGVTGIVYHMTTPGREGDYKYDASDLSSTDNGSTVIVAGTARYKRIIEGSVDVRWFGAVGDGSTNCTVPIQRAIDWCASQGQSSKVVFIPQGNYLVDSLRLRNGASIMGDNKRTTITARASSASGLFVLVDAPTQKISISNLTIVGNAANAGQHCFNITAIPQLVPAYTGGLWYSEFSFMDITGFRGHTFHFYCSDGLGDMANQFIDIYKVIVHSTADAGSRGLYVEGQMGQLKVQSCEFDGLAASNVGTVGVELKSITPSTNDFAWGISFDNTTIQNVWKAMYTSFAQNVVFQNGWLEDDSSGVHGTNASRLRILDNHIANVAEVAGTAIIINDDNSVIDLVGNGLYGALGGRVYTSSSQSSGSGDIRDNYFQNLGAITTVFVAGNINVSSGTLNSAYFRDIVTTATTNKSTYVVNINSSLGPGEFLTVRCDARFVPGGFVAFKPGLGNISYPGEVDSGFIVLRDKETAIFRRTDLFGDWALIALSKPERYSDTIPTVGSYYSGEKIWNNNPANGTLYWYCKLGSIPAVWDSVTTVPKANIIETSASTLSITAPGNYIFLGSSATWTLPPLASSYGKRYYLNNSTAGTVTLNANGSDDIMIGSSPSTTFPLTTGTIRLVGGTAHWYLE